MTERRIIPRGGPPDYQVMSRIEIDESTGCWNWIASVSSTGYGKMTLPGPGRDWRNPRIVSAHRFSYETFVGAIPPGLHIDHLCSNRLCVNPEHLEAVTPRENTMRAPNSVASINARKTACPRGHPFSTRKGGRVCIVCNENAKRTWIPQNVDLYEVVRLRRDGLSYREIGERLGVSHMAAAAACRTIFGSSPSLLELRGGSCRRGHDPAEIYRRANGRIAYCRACRREDDRARREELSA